MLEGYEYLGVAAEGVQRDALVDPGLREVRVDCQRAVVEPVMDSRSTE